VRQEAGYRLAAAIAQLPDARREVVLLRVVEGLSFADIAARTGRAVGALRVAFLRGVRQLRQILTGDDE
jgi:RNA polymerase sigma-70 factor (ECF subfamily)